MLRANAWSAVACARLTDPVVAHPASAIGSNVAARIMRGNDAL
jgi:hypothetical protein